MDKPLSALGKTLREEIRPAIRCIHRQTGVTTLHVTPTGKPLSIRLPFGHAAAAGRGRGATVSLSFDPASAHVFC